MDISIYVYGEHTSQACKVCHDEEMIEEKCADILVMRITSGLSVVSVY